jgi:ABC-2 type transport system ATP-binding protein
MDLRKRGKAILMSTHDIFRAKDVADRVGIMKEGRKVMERTREELQYENLERLYLDYMRGGIGPEPEEPKARKLSYKEPQGHDQNSN